MSISIRRTILFLGSLSLGFVVGCGDLPDRDTPPVTRGRSNCDARPAWPDPTQPANDAAQSAPMDAAVVAETGDGGASLDADLIGVDQAIEDAGTYDGDCGDAGTEISPTVVVLPDTQYYASAYPAIFEAQVGYILNQKGPRRITAVLHVGDVVDNIYFDDEWLAATKALRPLDGVLPYILVPGNHDQDGNRNGLMNKYFPPSSMPWLTGTMVPDQIENTYTLLDIGPRQWLVLALEFGPRNDTVAWANRILQAFPSVPAILVTHAFLYDDGTRYDWAAKGENQVYNPHWYNPTGAEGVNDGEELYQKLIVPNPSVRLVFSGHMNTTPWALARRTDIRPQGGAPVHQMLQNFQSNIRGGDGYLRLLEFDYAAGEIRVETYSPTLDRYIEDDTGRFSLPLFP